MQRRIVICPSFAESHLIKCHIPNMIEVLDPDIIIYNEGLFPQGPENKGHVDSDEFKKKWTHNKFKNTGFDYDELLQLETQYGFQSREEITTFGDIRQMHIFNPKIRVQPWTYPGMNDANDCAIHALSRFSLAGHDEPQSGDLIFPLEPDAFLWEGDKETINQLVSELKPGEGLSCKWVDFLETQFYTEAINLQTPKFRRFCYCFDTMENYKKAMDGFMSQDYPRLRKVNVFFIRHYCWWRPGKYKQLRYQLIHRGDPNYWKDFETGLQEIRSMTEMYVDYLKPNSDGTVNLNKIIPLNKILIRPSRQDEGRWAKFIDIEHPKAIQSHPNFVK